MKRTLLIALLIIATPGFAQSIRYVTDEAALPLRSGTTTEHRITRMVPSGTAVELLEERDGYSHVRLPEGRQGWILNRYLLDTPTARNQLADVEQRNAELVETTARLRQELAEVQQALADSDSSRLAFETGHAELSTELAELKRTAANALGLENRNQQLQERVELLEQQLRITRQEAQGLRDGSQRRWFLTGAGVLAGGLVLGLVLPRLRLRRRRSWGEL